MEETRNVFTCSYGEEDRISRLPDNLIHHIMSFNDMKYAVWTSLLSKRWIHVWKSLPILNFCRSSFSPRKTKRFIEFVYFVCIFRYDTNMQKFNVQWWDPESGIENKMIMNVNRWILFAVKRDVQEISIKIEFLRKSVYEIPHLLINCKSLRALDIIIMHEAGVDIILPTSMNLPQLRVLYLRGLSYSDVELSAKLLSSFPVLESLHIFHCDIQMDNHGNLIVASATL
ncbi:putative F-box/LRR-repeat protein At4g15060 [Papaver somniferum]|uniref:putative F-box/LRR-repeat protein At4g15060 n=1 Tax=Papaver somniferum TaxID=3469 RepID=UPI000E6FEF8E|nr:putative F-box/LRR-repeat protein At4g15060 [Papaver somniferum]